MIQLKLFLVGLSALCSIMGSASSEKIINCYWGTWSHYRGGIGAFQVNNIDPNLCTHLSYSFMGIHNKTYELTVLDEWLDLPGGLNNIAKVIDLKKINPKLKVILVAGGWNQGSTYFSRMAADPAKRKTFVQSVLKFVQKFKFDGFDLDWEYPAQREGSSPSDKANFVTLLKELYKALNPRGLLLGIAVGASAEHAKTSYQLPQIAKYLDFINVMTYDFATHFDGVFGYNAPLRGQGLRNVETAIEFWLSKGVPANKLVLGLAFYGHSFKLANDNEYALGSPTIGPGPAGIYTQQAGVLSYYEICQMKKSYNFHWAEVESVPVLHNSTDIISYDNAESIGLKVDFANAKNLSGVMIWSIESDDFRGLCGTTNILLKTVNNKMGHSQDMAPSGNENLPVKKPSQPNPPKHTLDVPKCIRDGSFPHNLNCSLFIDCANNITYVKTCPFGLHYDTKLKICNRPKYANCNLAAYQ